MDFFSWNQLKGSYHARNIAPRKDVLWCIPPRNLQMHLQSNLRRHTICPFPHLDCSWTCLSTKPCLYWPARGFEAGFIREFYKLA